MTAPVSQEAGGERIPMTAPVNQEAAGDQWSICFIMPPGSALEKLPEPIDGEVKLKAVPGRLVAALTYSGRWSRGRYARKEAELRRMIRDRGLAVEGNPVWARYNPPFTLWFLRRNEVLIPVGESQGAPP